VKKTMTSLGAVAALTLGTLGVLVAAPGTANAVTPTVTEVTFTGETLGAKPNGYATAAVPGVHFSDTLGPSVIVADVGVATHGPAIASGAPNTSGLEIRLTGPTTAISMGFGFDTGMNATDQAQLTLYRGATQVGQVEVNVNANTVMDQRINYGGPRLFNRAVFRYVDAAGAPKNNYEVVDDIKLNPICTIAGNDGDNFLVGTPQADVICGDTGNDRINGNAGNDLIYPGAGWDTVNAGLGADTVLDNAGNDHLNGSDGADDIRAGIGRDVLRGGTGNDRLDGGPHADVCRGDAGHDVAVRCEVRRSIP
jgi:hypothetical protein